MCNYHAVKIDRSGTLNHSKQCIRVMKGTNLYICRSALEKKIGSKLEEKNISDAPSQILCLFHFATQFLTVSEYLQTGLRIRIRSDPDLLAGSGSESFPLDPDPIPDPDPSLAI